VNNKPREKNKTVHILLQGIRYKLLKTKINALGKNDQYVKMSNFKSTQPHALVMS